MKPTKIYELKGLDWMKGTSIQDGIALGGIFQTTNNFDPFEKMGYYRASLASVVIDATTITSTITSLTSVASGVEGYVFGINDSVIDKTKSLYRIKMSDSTVTDYSNQIDQNTGNPITHNGITTYLSRLVYEQGGSLRSNTYPPTTGNDTNILTSALTGSSLRPTRFSIGIDGSLYFINTTGLGKIVTVTSTTNNTASAFVLADTQMVAKDITNDEIHVVFIADDNENKVSTATSKCSVFFWDTIKSKADIIWDIPDSYLISCRYVDGKILILGASGLWVCNSITAPRLIFPMTSTLLPPSANAVDVYQNTMYWASGATGSRIYAYGSKIGKSILFSPYQSSGGSDLQKALISSGTYFVATTTQPNTYLHNSGSTRSNSSLQTVTTQLVQPYSLSYIKVTLQKPLSSGQAIAISVHNGAGGLLSDTTTKQFSVDGAKQTFIFPVTPSASSIKSFEDITISVNPQAGAVVQRVCVYAVPTDDFSQNI